MSLLLQENQVEHLLNVCKTQTWVSVHHSTLEDLLKAQNLVAEAKKVIEQYRSNHKPAGSHHCCAQDPLWSDYMCQQCKDAMRFIALLDDVKGDVKDEGTQIRR
jgi:hypothetical protein